MIAIVLLADGELDKAAIPPILANHLETEVHCTLRTWRSVRLHGCAGSHPGYGRKLNFVSRDLCGAHGIVAVVDRDRSSGCERLNELKAARDADRAKRTPVPTALGEANPHLEAWLLDDAEAVKSALQLPAGSPVPKVAGDPKADLEALHAGSSRCGDPKVAAWKDIACAVRLTSSRNPKKTGFDAFLREVTAELGSLVRARS